MKGKRLARPIKKNTCFWASYFGCVVAYRLPAPQRECGVHPAGWGAGKPIGWWLSNPSDDDYQAHQTMTLTVTLTFGAWRHNTAEAVSGPQTRLRIREFLSNLDVNPGASRTRRPHLLFGVKTLDLWPLHQSESARCNQDQIRTAEWSSLATKWPQTCFCRSRQDH